MAGKYSGPHGLRRESRVKFAGTVIPNLTRSGYIEDPVKANFSTFFRAVARQAWAW